MTASATSKCFYSCIEFLLAERSKLLRLVRKVLDERSSCRSSSSSASYCSKYAALDLGVELDPGLSSVLSKLWLRANPFPTGPSLPTKSRSLLSSSGRNSSGRRVRAKAS